MPATAMERDLACLETKGIEGYVAVGRDGRRAAGTRLRAGHRPHGGQAGHR